MNTSSNEIPIHINYEHTLVAPGGRDSNGSPSGCISLLHDEKNSYLVRITDLEMVKKCKILIDYSLTNCKNIELSPDYNYLHRKIVYVPPILYPLIINDNQRSIEILTTFINVNEPRRSTLINRLRESNLPHININNCFNKDALQSLYLDTKILINIHQTDHHHTFEELRVLPALLCGIIIICEETPLKELIPYRDFIIFESYDNIVKKTQDVYKNYDYNYKLLFGDEKKHRLNELITQMQNTSLNNLLKQINIV